MQKEKPFWQVKSLEDMSLDEREALCDGCSRCCLQKLEDEDSGQTFFTRVACHLLDADSCRCKDYDNRFDRVTDCTQIYPLTKEKLNWLPSSCAYLKIAKGQALAEWHHLISGDRNTVHLANISIRDWAISEHYVDESLYEELIVDINAI